MEQPEVLEWLAAAGQVLDADPDDGASHDRQLGVGWPAGPVPTTAEFLVHAAPGMDPYRAVAGGQGGPPCPPATARYGSMPGAACTRNSAVVGTGPAGHPTPSCRSCEAPSSGSASSTCPAA